MTRTRFTTELQEQVAALIDGVPPEEHVSWKQVAEFAAGLGVKLTRQWLHRSTLVAEAYRRHCEAEKADREETSETTELGSLKREVERLRKLQEESDRRFLRWIHNANEMNVGIEQLDRDIPVMGG